MSSEKSGMMMQQDATQPPPPYTDNPAPQPGYGYNQPVGQPGVPQPGYSQPAYPAAPQGGYPPQPGYNVQYVVAPPAQVMTTGPAPPDYMGRAIFVTLCCFWPTGIFAIIKASDARSAVQRGDLVSARTYADSARQMINISLIAGILSIVVACIIIGVYVGLVVNSVSKYHD